MASTANAPASEPDYSEIFFGVPTPLLVLTPEFQVVTANDAYLEATMTRREELIGRPLFELFPNNPDDPGADGMQKLHASLTRVRDRKEPDIMGIQKYDIRNSEGEFEERYWIPMNSPILDQQGSVRYLIHRAEDVTQLVRDRSDTALREAAQAARAVEVHLDIRRLRDANEALELERSMREQFVLTLSHDLRTPLAAARMAAQMLFRKLDDALAATTLLARLVTNIDRADQMIQDLLDANRLRAGKPLPLNIVACELRGMVREVLDELATLHGDRFELDACKVIKGHWCCKELSRLVENLCINGIKHGDPEGPVVVALHRYGDEVSIEVRNEGPPIPKEELARLFDPFHRADASHDRKGWGLGLTLVRGIAEAHGGRVEVESAEDKGTVFRVHLPLDARQ